MQSRLMLLVALVVPTLIGLASCTAQAPAPAPADSPAPAATAPVPPVAEVRPFPVPSPNGTRTDEYYWLRDDTRSAPAVLGYLEAENAYYAAMTARTKSLEDRVYGEIVTRIQQDDSSVPYRKRGYWYYTRYETGREHPIYARRAGTLEAPEQVMLDANALGEGHGFYAVGTRSVAPNDRLLAYVDDTVGRRQFTLRFKDLTTGRTLPETIPNVESSLAWNANSDGVLYIEKNPVTLLGYRVKRHVLGTDPAGDPLVYEQDDLSYYTNLATTKDERYLLIVGVSTEATEVRYADARDPGLAFRVLLPRERGHEYWVDHLGSRWIIRSNWQAPNFRLLEVEDRHVGDRGRWRELVAHRDDAFIDGFDVFRDFLAIEERSDALRRIRIRPWQGGPDSLIAAEESAYTTYLGVNPELDTHSLRYEYTSLTTPDTTYEYDVVSGSRRLLKRRPVLGGYDPANYRTELLWATARDGVRVPVSVVYRKDTRIDGTAPLYQYGYGSYGSSLDPTFDITLLPLLDRGFVYALANIRGGMELGRRWYDDGRLLNKKNTFTDFVDVTRFLVKSGYADPKRVSGTGLSAGGLLIGAVANMAPGDYRALVANVPFVDVVTTMLDESIPLVTNEFDEWGNPKEKLYYDYMLSYSPYDNVARQDYPAMLVTTALYDSQVQYYEPAKWVARLRARKTDKNPLLFRTSTDAGHGGKSGRFESYRQIAQEYAFVLDQLGVTQ
jgi:oligopeptidase B